MLFVGLFSGWVTLVESSKVALGVYLWGIWIGGFSDGVAI